MVSCRVFVLPVFVVFEVVWASLGEEGFYPVAGGVEGFFAVVVFDGALAEVCSGVGAEELDAG